MGTYRTIAVMIKTSHIQSVAYNALGLAIDVGINRLYSNVTLYGIVFDALPLPITEVRQNGSIHVYDVEPFKAKFKEMRHTKGYHRFWLLGNPTEVEAKRRKKV